MCLAWRKIFDVVTNCNCYRELKAWKVKNRYFTPRVGETEEQKNKRLGPRPRPTFLCCRGKNVKINDALTKYLNNQTFRRAIEILRLPSDARLKKTKLMECNEFLMLYYTLFSKKGQESCLYEAGSWRGSDDVPSHCMFFGEEKLNIPFISDVCMEILDES